MYNVRTPAKNLKRGLTVAGGQSTSAQVYKNDT